MATTQILHGQLSDVDDQGNVKILHVETSATDVKVDRTANTQGTNGTSNIPTDVDTMQKLANKMGALAFKSKVAVSDLANGVVTQDLNVTTSGKIMDARVGKALDTRLKTIEDENLVVVGETEDVTELLPTTEVNDSVTSKTLTWSSKKISDELTQLNSNDDSAHLELKNKLSEEAERRKILENRMNTFTKLEEGSTTADAELIDVRVGYDGTTYETAGNAVRGQVSRLSESITDLKGDIYTDILQLETEINYAPEYTLTGWCYVNEWSVDDSNYDIYFYPVEAGKTYRVVGSTYGDAKTAVLKKTQYNDGMTKVLDPAESGHVERKVDLTFVAEDGYSLIALSVPPQKFDTFSVFVGRKEPVYLPTIEKVSKLTDGIFVVDKAGRGDFTGIREAVLYLTEKYSALELHNYPRIIFVRNGVYSEDPTHEAPYAAIPKGANKISIIGESRDGVIINCHISANAHGRCIEGGGECEICNLTINVLNDGTLTPETYDTSGAPRPYCIHNDADPYDYGYDRSYTTAIRNCRLYSEGMNPVGAGLHHNQTQVYENVECIFNSAFSNGNGALYIHAPASTSAVAKGVVVDGCTLISQNGAKAITLPNVSGTQNYSSIPVSIRRTIGITNGENISDISKSTHALQKDSALNNVVEWNY